MNRCPTHASSLFRPARRSALALTLAAVALPGLAPAQSLTPPPVQSQHEAATGGRHFPAGALRGRIAFGAFPEIALDGRAERLAPGARVRNTQNLIVRPGTLGGQYLAVNYRRDVAGLVSDVWILTPQEAGAERASAGGKPLLNIWPFVSRAQNETR